MKDSIRQALDERGYTSLTPVQEAVLAPELDGQDLLVSAQTGSGKTLGFGLAIAPTLLPDGDQFTHANAPLALIIAPTRELALQVKRELGWLYAKAGATLASCVGGMDMRDERRALARGAHIVAATPGRLRDHIMRGSIDLSQLRAVVLDEADEMLDLGFREDLEFILEAAPADRQTLMFSATVPKQITELAKSYQNDAQRIVARSETTQHTDIEYRAMTVALHDVENAIINTLRFYEAPNAIVFANTRATVNRLTTRLSNRGLQVVALSGELSQAERSHALQAMRDGRAQVCVATDVAARGIDLPNLDLVIHAELPSSHETLLHRSGRTGRAGRKGVSALVVPGKFSKKAQRILGMAKLKADWGPAPSAEEVKARDHTRMLADPVWQEVPSEAEQTAMAELLSTFTPEQITLAYLKLHQSRYSAPEELSDVADSTPRPRQEFGPSQWFAVTGGRDAGAEPRRLLPMLCKAGDLTKDDIGAIRVQASVSYVQIRNESVAGFLSAIGPEMTLEEGAQLSQLTEPPVLERPERPRGKPAGKPFGKPYDKPQGKPHHRGKKPAHSEEPVQTARAKPSKPHKPKPRQEADPRADRPRAEAPRARDSQPDRQAKPAHKPKTAGKRGKDDKGGQEAPRRRSDSGKPAGAHDPSKRLKGPPPPKGKSNSKKNKARALVAKEAKGAGKRGKPKGG